jgi:chemotaxis protein methyltransferase CheR
MALTARRTNAAYAASEFAVPDHELEFPFSEADFRGFVQLAHLHAGIALADSKRNLVYSRLSRRLRALGMTSFREYRTYLDGDGGDQEIVSFINAISTNLTKFFRESHHFDHLQAHVATPFATRRNGARLRIWSAGCSTGEEPYTIAVVLKREIRDVEAQDVRILATDIDTEVLGKAGRGEYPLGSIEEVPKAYRQFFPIAKGGKDGGQILFDDATKRLIAFRRLNLMEPWPFQGLFDAIFCRNVMIYFDGPTKAKLIDRFTRQVKPGGWLYIGHSESLIGTHPGLELVGRTTYRRAQ